MLLSRLGSISQSTRSGGSGLLPKGAPGRSASAVFATGFTRSSLFFVTLFAAPGRPSAALVLVVITSGASLVVRLYLTRRALRGRIG